MKENSESTSWEMNGQNKREFFVTPPSFNYKFDFNPLVASNDRP